MSIRQVSTDLRIAKMAGDQEYLHARMLGHSVREALQSACRVLEEILSIARRSDEGSYLTRG
jgi:hypothetical protein